MIVREEPAKNSDDGEGGGEDEEAEADGGGGHANRGQVQFEDAQGEAEGRKSRSRSGQHCREEDGRREERSRWWSFRGEVLLSCLGQRADQREGEHSCGEDGGSADAEWEEKSRGVVDEGTEDITETEPEPKGGVSEGVDSCGACGVGGQEDGKDVRPEDGCAEAFHEPDEVGRDQEKAQLRNEHNGAKECRGKSCQKNPTNKDGKKPKPVDLEHLY